MEGPLIDDTRRLDDEDTYDAEQQVAQQSRAIAERLLAQENERNTVVEVYRDAWRDFYNWEPEPCSSLIRSLAPAHIEWDEVTAVPLDIPAESMVVDEVVTSLFRVFDLERDRLTVLDEEFIRTPDFAPHPKYEACTPTMHIIKSDEETDWLRFITYAGDPGFAEQDLLRDHKRYNWQDGIRDPDADLIGLEAIHRLEGRSLSYDTVDAHSVLPRLLGHNGLIWRMSHRDLWHWPELPELLHVPLDDHTLKTQVNEKGRRHQCPNTHLQQATYPVCSIDMQAVCNEILTVSAQQLIVKNGQHGQGTFANVDIGKDTVIGEYIAELFPNELSHFLHALFTHRHLNYTFNVNVRDVLDAAWVGNETRYMNHAKGKAENITAHMKWVDGELRIAFSSTKRIKKGNELLFDYGTEYWKDHEQEP
ncbi:hypothetical protein EVJ58_g4096 [Rhodofomes roseus]|uniref:SET domain-containing protein n=1 Tax=Rhodofomes roseus TaxID=34475 RepID=A0A4Y9YJA9_9APHY|nr:hypothetical protein EVJ58_g4096 [Rhodofomes roseus]